MSSTEMPQDSVLRRHWQAARAMETQTASPASSSSSAESSSGGFFGWLKSLFS